MEVYSSIGIHDPESRSCILSPTFVIGYCEMVGKRGSVCGGVRVFKNDTLTYLFELKERN